MRKLLFALVLLASPAWAQTQMLPKSATARIDKSATARVDKSATARVDNCAPIGRTEDGKLVAVVTQTQMVL